MWSSENIFSFLNFSDKNFNMYLMTGVVLLITILLLFVLYRRRKSTRRTVLLMGLTESGKTLLFSNLINSKYVSTHTSIKENVGEYSTGKRVLRVVDVPGHERVRERFFDKYKDQTRAIVFLVNSLTVTKDIRDVADYLYGILTDSVIMTHAPRILILCNKQDDVLAKGSAAVKSLLEKEMSTLRVVKGSHLESLDAKKKKVTLGKLEIDFNFENIPPFRFDFAESQMITSKTDIDSLKKWLIEIS